MTVDERIVLHSVEPAVWGLSSDAVFQKNLPDIEQWSQSSGSNVIPRRARPGLAGPRPHMGEHLDLPHSINELVSLKSIHP